MSNKDWDDYSELEKDAYMDGYNDGKRVWVIICLVFVFILGSTIINLLFF